MSPAAQYAPQFTIDVGGNDLRNAGVDVLSVSVTDTSDRADAFNFTVRDRHPDPGRFAAGAKLKWMDDPLFDEGAKVKIKLGYVNNLGLEFWGLITAATPSFSESGAPTLSVRGFSYYWELQRQHREKPFKTATDQQIAAECASDLNLAPDVDPTSITYELVSPNSATYANFLSGRARRIGFELVVKQDRLCFKKPGYFGAPGPALTLEWGKDLRSFNPSLSLYDMVTEVEARGSQTALGKGKQPLVGRAQAGSERLKMGSRSGSEIAQAAGIKNHLLVQDHNITSQAEADELALVQLETHSLNYISGRGACMGNPGLTARSMVELKGLGQRFSGNYYVTSATHIIDSGGYRTDFEVRRNGR